MSEEIRDDEEESDVSGLMCVLLTEEPVRPDERYLQAVERHCGEIDGKVDEHMAVAFHKTRVVQYEDAAIPSQTAIFVTDEPFSPQSCEDALQQTYDWAQAADTVARCRHGVLLTEMMAAGLEPAARLETFCGALKAALETYEVQALHWPISQKVVAPSAFLDACAKGTALCAGPVNVRMFNIEGQEQDETVMDTLGMAPFFLPDLQCHFRGLDPGKVASFLFNTAQYLFDEGAVIEDGQTVSGIEADHRWPCQHEESIVPPQRIVLDVNPVPFGPPR